MYERRSKSNYRKAALKAWKTKRTKLRRKKK